MFLLNMVKGHHLQLRCWPPLFQYFMWFNIEADMAIYPVIQKEVEELLAKGAIEPSTGDLAVILMSLLFLSVLVAF